MFSLGCFDILLTLSGYVSTVRFVELSRFLQGLIHCTIRCSNQTTKVLEQRPSETYLI